MCSGSKIPGILGWLACLVLVCGATTRAAGQTCTIDSPTSGSNYQAGGSVSVSFSVAGFNSGIQYIIVGGTYEMYSMVFGPFSESSPVSTYISSATYSIPYHVVNGERLNVSVIALGYQETSATARIEVVVQDPGPPPGNDNFAAAWTLTGDSGTTTAGNHNATAEPGEPLHSHAGLARSVWWKWTAPANGTVKFQATSFEFTPLLGVYVGSQLDNLTSVDPDPPPVLSGMMSRGSVPDDPLGTAIVPVTQGTTYALAVDGFDYRWGEFDLSWTPHTTVADWMQYP